MFDYIRKPQGNIVSQPNFSQYLPQGQNREVIPKETQFWVDGAGNQFQSEPGNDFVFN